MTTRREQTSTESRDLILAAAADLFAEKGYRQNKFVDMAARSVIIAGFIPWHFRKQGRASCWRGFNASSKPWENLPARHEDCWLCFQPAQHHD